MTYLAAGLAMMLLWAALWSVATAHHAPSGWTYPTSCCNAIDCYVEHVENVVVTSKGYYLPEFSRFIPFEAANTSPDEDFHVCTTYDGEKVRSVTVDTQYERERMNRSGVCFWAPEGGV